MLALWLIATLVVLLLNAFFAYAEFAAVKIRGSWVKSLEESGERRAPALRHIHTHLDEYLSVVQVGITLTSIGLGFLGEPAVARLIDPLTARLGAIAPAVSHGIAIAIAFVLVSYLHIVCGELVPKGIAVRYPEQAALRTARAMRFFHRLFAIPRFVLHRSARAILRLLGLPTRGAGETQSEEEIRAILSQSQTRGGMSLRRLLLHENVFDFAGLRVRDAMRARAQAACLRTDMAWPEALRFMRETRFTRYPLVDAADRVVGVINAKDVLYETTQGRPPAELTALARPAVTVPPDISLEQLLGDFQHRRTQMAIVRQTHDRWLGLITMENVIEELVGTIEDEFEVEPRLFLADTLSPDRIVLDVQASSLLAAIRAVVESVPRAALPMPPERLVSAILQREAAMSTYVGAGLAVPHARLEGLDRALVIVGRSAQGIPVAGGVDRVHLMFLVLTPHGEPRQQVRIVGRIARLFESDYVLERLRNATTADDLLAAIREGDQSS